MNPDKIHALLTKLGYTQREVLAHMVYLQYYKQDVDDLTEQTVSIECFVHRDGRCAQLAGEHGEFNIRTDLIEIDADFQQRYERSLIDLLHTLEEHSNGR